jgi:hypothetical protein
MKTKRISVARLELVADRNGDILWEPRKVPLMRDTLGISQRAELARQAMASPVERHPTILKRPPLADFDDLLPFKTRMWGLFGLVICSWLVIAGLGVLVWSWL